MGMDANHAVEFMRLLIVNAKVLAKLDELERHSFPASSGSRSWTGDRIGGIWI